MTYVCVCTCMSIWVFFIKILFIYSWETQREKQAPCWELDAGLNPRTSRSQSEPKADAQLLSHPGAPVYVLLLCFSHDLLLWNNLTNYISFIFTFLCIFIFNCSTVDIQHYIVSDVQYSDLTIIYIMKCSPQWVLLPSVTM